MSITIALQITESEKTALLTVLPLVEYISISNPIRLDIFKRAAGIALSKLKSDSFLFSEIELETISICVDAGVTLCSGPAGFFAACTPILEWQRKLAPHYFSLRKLAPVLGGFVDENLRRT